MRPASRCVWYRSSIPIRNLIVTGTGPAASTAARTIARNSFGLSGIAAPPPLLVTLRTGQPKFMSRWSTRRSPTSSRTASPT